MEKNDEFSCPFSDKTMNYIKSGIVAVCFIMAIYCFLKALS